MTLSPTSSRGGGTTQQFVRVTLRHSADFANLDGAAPVVATSTFRVGVGLTLPPSLFGNDSIIDVLVSNGNATDVVVDGSLVVQNAAGTVWIEQDTASDQTIAAGASTKLDFANNGGSAGVGLTWNGTTKQVDIASAGVYSAFATLSALPA